ncbi:MAG TPA: AAA family ATPase [Syntrophorhabdaceae bacterium]|nr:AAA family ATPase [Syntrophorhabdaceae bacterium]
MSKGHSEALAHLMYGVNTDGGFILLTGEVGTGKTTVCRCLLDHLPENSEVAFLLNPKVSVIELLASICDEFRIAYPQGNTSNKVFVSAINDYLLSAHERGKRAILIIEEAQNLSVDVLEQVRLLTNLETSQRKLLQIVLLGQPELRRLLAQPRLRQLNQRITVRYHLSPLLKDEIPAYVKHRLAVAGFERSQLFSKKQLAELHRLTGGIPRLINIICDRALIGAFVQNKSAVDSKTLLTAAREVSGKKTQLATRKDVLLLSGIILLMIILAALALTFYGFQKGTPSRAPAAVRQQVATPVVPVSVTLNKPDTMSEAESFRTAYENLFHQWQVPANVDEHTDICEQAKEKGLRCLVGRGSLIELRQINKPAVLTLFDQAKGKYFGTLISLAEGTALVSLGKEQKSVRVEEIFSRWTGEYTLFWKIPFEYTSPLIRGGRGSFVEWLDQRLAIINKRSVSENKQIYDEELMKQVKQFQISVGLVPDGIVGTRTLIHLSGAADLNGPSLRPGKGEQQNVVHP